MVVDYIIHEEIRTYSYELLLHSGDVFVVNSEVQGLDIGIKEVHEKTRPAGLVLKDGSLVLTVERE